MIRKKSLAKALALTLSVSMLGTSLPGSVTVAAEAQDTETATQSQSDDATGDKEDSGEEMQKLMKKKTVSTKKIVHSLLLRRNLPKKTNLQRNPMRTQQRRKKLRPKKNQL